MYPLPANHKSGEGVRFLSADEINTIEKMLNGLRVDVVEGLDHGEVIAPDQNGGNWTIRVPLGGAGSISAEESDGDPAVDEVSKIKFDADHFVLANEGNGVVLLAAKVEECTVVTNVRFDSSTLQLQKKTRKVKVIFIEDEDESGWTMMEGGQAEVCP